MSTQIPGEPPEGTPYSEGLNNPGNLNNLTTTLVTNVAGDVSLGGDATMAGLDRASNVDIGDTIYITLDDGTIFSDLVTAISGTVATWTNEPVPGTGTTVASIGNFVRVTANKTNNFDATSLESTQGPAAAEQLLICDRSGFKITAKEGLRQTWDNFMVRAESWEPRQPLDFVRSRPETGQKGSPRPEQADKFLGTNEVSADDL